MIVADTGVLIDFLHGRGPAADRIALELGHGQLKTTVVSRFELLAGVRTPRQERVVLDLLAAVPALPLDDAAADRAAAVRRDLETSGTGIGMGESLIAGIVLTHGALLLTRNRAHFERVPGLTLARLE